MVLVLATLAILVILLCLHCRRPSGQPPGPTGLPLLGCLPWMDRENPLKKFEDWAKKYEKLYHVKLGTNNYLVLCDARLIRDTFARAELAFRPPMASFDLVEEGDGIIFSRGKRWRDTRRTTLYHLHNFGLGRSGLEPVILEQVEGFIAHTLQPNANKPVTIGPSLHLAIVNTLWFIMTSQKLSLNDHSVLEQIEQLKMLFSEEIAPLRLADYIPELTWLILRYFFDSTKYLQKLNQAIKFIFSAIEEHRLEIKPGESRDARDYIEALLLEQQKQPDLYTDHHISRCLLDLFSAGSETAATTLRWAIIFLADHPEVSQRIQCEIDAVSGNGSAHVLLENRTQMPYTEAFLHEVQRFANIAPISVPRVVTSPIYVEGYHVPEGTIVISLLSATHFDRNHFKQPDSFIPERFLDGENPPVFKTDTHVMPFGTGKRQCIGKSLARDELFLFLTNILKHFRFSWPQGQRPDIKIELLDSLISSPAAFHVVPVPR